jgi:hypothetical protein
VEDRPGGHRVLPVLALAVLEHAGTPEARRLLRELAGGTPGAWLTEEAQGRVGGGSLLPQDGN